MKNALPFLLIAGAGVVAWLIWSKDETIATGTPLQTIASTTPPPPVEDLPANTAQQILAENAIPAAQQTTIRKPTRTR